MRRTNLILAQMAEFRTEIRTELREFRTEVRADLHAMNGRIDALNGRVDTVIDALADLRSDFDRHSHDN